ncbi:hypothetical protein X777_04069 [Ooceraea biroi]|uniref:Uncharacterized protein n=1 Tax=Ooceraea biroi TaxID=2015173 RepID=A0A026WI47_OOCBI|nr:hypothetical protein X777_04069 [Ooceraea biroi]
MEFGSFKVTGPRVRMRRRAELGRRLTRRLSIVARMPAAILSRANPPEPRQVEITAIAPDKTQLMVGSSALTDTAGLSPERDRGIWCRNETDRPPCRVYAPAFQAFYPIPDLEYFRLYEDFCKRI